MAEQLQDLGDYIAKGNQQAVTATSVRLGELMIAAKPEGLVALLTFLRDDPRCLFKQLVDVCGVDWPEREKRFDVVYNLLSVKNNQRVRVK
ncbi:MAG: NADH-quinone oxidoreductase subunit C, partial [Reyranella sp.]|nr:NADH-quinone oxidoreductase subunit C [Reyranella sp.]